MLAATQPVSLPPALGHRAYLYLGTKRYCPTAHCIGRRRDFELKDGYMSIVVLTAPMMWGELKMLLALEGGESLRTLHTPLDCSASVEFEEAYAKAVADAIATVVAKDPTVAFSVRPFFSATKTQRATAAEPERVARPQPPATMGL